MSDLNLSPVLEAIARQLCREEGQNPDATFLCGGCAELHPMWEAMTGDAETLLNTLEAAGYSAVRLN